MAQLAPIVPLPELTDEEIALRVKGGERNLFEKLVLRHRRKIFIHSLSKNFSPEESEDLAQETFLKAYKYLHSYNPENPFKFWLQKILQNLISDQYKKRARVPTPTESSILEKNLTSKEDPFEDTHQKIILESFSAILELMPPPFSETARLRFIQEFSYEEIAEHLQINSGTVMSRLYRAKKWLQKNGFGGKK